jgi:hypothetical protein
VNIRESLRSVKVRRRGDLEQRVADLEQVVTELRRHNLRVAELVDVVQELLVPMASRDEQRIQDAIAKFGKSI